MGRRVVGMMSWFWVDLVECVGGAAAESDFSSSPGLVTWKQYKEVQIIKNVGIKTPWISSVEANLLDNLGKYLFKGKNLILSKKWKG